MRTTWQMSAPFEELADLDRLVHDPSRLAILTALSACKSADFLYLQRLTGLSKGNLSIQAQKLEAAGYVQTMKGFRGRIPMTTFRITVEGRKALAAYHGQMRALLPKIPKK